MLNFSIRSSSANIDTQAFRVPISSKVFSSKPNEYKPNSSGSGIGSSCLKLLVLQIGLMFNLILMKEYKQIYGKTINFLLVRRDMIG